MHQGYLVLKFAHIPSLFLYITNIIVNFFVKFFDYKNWLFSTLKLWREKFICVLFSHVIRVKWKKMQINFSSQNFSALNIILLPKCKKKQEYLLLLLLYLIAKLSVIYNTEPSWWHHCPDVLRNSWYGPMMVPYNDLLVESNVLENLSVFSFR